MNHLRTALAVACLTGVAATSSASIWTFNDILDESQVVSPSGSPATGTASGSYDDVTNALTIDVIASGFLSARTGAHIHAAPVGANGGVVFDLGVSGAGSNYTNPNKNFVLSEAQESDFLSGLYYVQIHTTNNPGGSIRGQLNPVPEPASLFALGLGALALLRRRRQK